MHVYLSQGLLFDDIDQPVCFNYNTMEFLLLLLSRKIEIRDGGKSRNFPSIQDCFNYPENFVFPYEVENCPFKVCKNVCWSFDENSIEFVDCFQ